MDVLVFKILILKISALLQLSEFLIHLNLCELFEYKFCTPIRTNFILLTRHINSTFFTNFVHFITCHFLFIFRSFFWIKIWNLDACQLWLLIHEMISIILIKNNIIKPRSWMWIYYFLQYTTILKRFFYLKYELFKSLIVI